MHGSRIRTLLFVIASCCAGAENARAQERAAEPVSIGGAKSSGAVLEMPRSILVARDRIIVIEKSAPFFKVFDFRGRLLQTTGRFGAGPGEYRLAAASIVDTAHSQILVFDTPLGRVTRLSLRDTLEFVSSQSLSLQVESACFLGSRLFASVLTAEGMIHELSGVGPELRVARSFGVARANHALTGNSLFQNYLADGHLSCDEATGRVVLASKLTGYVHQFEVRTGTQVTVPIESFQPIVFGIIGNGLQLATPPSRSYEEVLAVRRTSTELVLDLGRTSDEHNGAGDYAGYREVRLGGSAQKASARLTRWRFVGAANRRAVCYTTRPEPEIIIAAGPTCP